MFDLSNITKGITTFLIGMVVVLSALAIIWCVVSLIGKAFSAKKESALPEEKPTPAPTPTPVASAPAIQTENTAEIVAAITAAICAYENRPVGSFRVVSFKKR